MTSALTSPNSEVQLIRKIQQLASRFPSPPMRPFLSIGDDAAAFRGARNSLLLISTDALLEGIHFSLQYCSPEDIGWKVLAVNLSDIAAMGGTPLYFTTSIAVPKSTNSQWIQKLYRGMLQLAAKANVCLIGGDTCASPGGVFLDLTIIGEVKPSEILTRKGAQPGDVVFVTGKLGGSAIGFEMLNHHLKLARKFPQETSRHLRPLPRSEVGRFLASRHYASSLIDISDGLSTDLHHLCEQSQVGAVIDAAKIPLARINSRVSSYLSKTLLDYALHGGEDYELLFTVPRRLKSKIPESIHGTAIREIGEITSEARRCWLRQQGRLRKLSPAGFDHFR